MRSNILSPVFLLTLLSASTTTTTASRTARIYPTYQSSCSPSTSSTTTTSSSTTTTTNPEHTHTTEHKFYKITARTPNHSPYHDIHPGTCQSIPLHHTQAYPPTHISFSTQLLGDDPSDDSSNNAPSRCNVTLHERPGCVDRPLFVSPVHSTTSQECVPRTHGPNSAVDDDGVWAMMECEDDGHDQGSEDESVPSPFGKPHDGDDDDDDDDDDFPTPFSKPHNNDDDDEDEDDSPSFGSHNHDHDDGHDHDQDQDDDESDGDNNNNTTNDDNNDDGDNEDEDDDEDKNIQNTPKTPFPKIPSLFHGSLLNSTSGVNATQGINATTASAWRLAFRRGSRKARGMWMN
ncbi:hypothetical protein BO70DRAFT_383080 [Aspergillus heteromorphus CBS 117.55]|uniref:Uncharacterized protein n=1 Tax=Aspergillus heteromorphus CBS 117.55 TaxID=1448321 RepID=A0A317V0S1_9EURO|nr:uncharacterized protein BO70DRAFT_383080 [Aspergillus heteromorphus CBS 117.55]PWY66417.1 hypothetical protein BO70DRAFT_383080 [Aspergillus heteromorphus CBS 117.55]